MKKNKNIYILLPMVLLIWGLLGYKVFTAVGPKKAKTPEKIVSNFTPKEIKKAEPFSIHTNYQDPFFGPDSYRDQKPKKLKPKKVIKKPTKPFPKIVFKGVVSSGSNKSQVFLITINGKQHFFKQHKTFDGVKLVRGNAKEVVLVFEGERKSFPLSK